MYLVRAGLLEEKRRVLCPTSMFWHRKYNLVGVLVVFDLFAYPVYWFLHFKLPAFTYLFTSAFPWKRWDTLGDVSSFQGISPPLRLESAICCEALGKNTEFEIHYSSLMRFILKNLYVHWPWLEKWYHKIRMFFHSVTVLYSL